MECQISAAPQDNDHRDQQEGIEARAKPKQGRLGGGSAGRAGQQRGGRCARQSRTGNCRWGDWRGCGCDGGHPNLLGIGAKLSQDSVSVIIGVSKSNRATVYVELRVSVRLCRSLRPSDINKS